LPEDILRKIVLFSILIVILAAFFASSSPDGLEKVAEKLGFIGKGAESRSILTDYSLPFLKSGPVNTAAAGVVGVGLILATFLGIKSMCRGAGRSGR
jgi:hypothetical protein